MLHLTAALDPASQVPLYEQLYRSIAREISAGALPAGARMPGRRSLAEALSVSVNTVDGAYQMLAAEGYLASRPRSGFYVQEYPARPAPPGQDAPPPALPAALLEGVTAYYQERGALYGIQEEVERAYQAYRQSEDPEEFSYFLVVQRVEWTATAPGVYYFRTTVTLPVREQEITEYQFTDAFDKETGEHIPNQDLFTVGQAEAIAAIVAGTQAIGQEAQAMEEYFQWPYLSFEPDELVVCYPAGALPGQEPTSIWGVDYSGLVDVLHPWAVPETPEQ